MTVSIIPFFKVIGWTRVRFENLLLIAQFAQTRNGQLTHFATHQLILAIGSPRFSNLYFTRAIMHGYFKVGYQQRVSKLGTGK